VPEPSPDSPGTEGNLVTPAAKQQSLGAVPAAFVIPYCEASLKLGLEFECGTAVCAQRSRLFD
jgi:hypothetical protein